MATPKQLGMAIAVSAAAMFIAGCASSGSGVAEPAEATVACKGGNACKGRSECHTAGNECAGQNACKGQGFVSLTPDECRKVTEGG